MFLQRSCLTIFYMTEFLHLLLKICFSARTKVVQLVKPNNFLGYSQVRFPQKTWLTTFDGFCTNLGMKISLLLIGKPVYQQRQELFSWSSLTTFSVTAKYVFLREPGLLGEMGRETPVAAERHRTDFKYRVTIKLLPFLVLPHSQIYCRDESYYFCERLKVHAELSTKQNEHAIICFVNSSACAFNRSQK